MMLTSDNTAQMMPEPERPSRLTASRLVQRKCACGGSTGVTDTCTNCSANKLSIVQRSVSGVVQRQLAISEPHDVYEQEADHIADQVMRMAEPNATPAKSSPPAIQRMCAGCEEEEEQVQRQAASAGPAGEVSQTQGAAIESVKAGGESLPAGSRNFFEQRFGHDFGSVRVHADDRAAQSARELNALAYTTGEHIVFGAGQYSPNTQTGQKLLAHELTHVIQQNGGQQVALKDDQTTGK